ncbi:MAG: tail-specific protease [Bdellovibrionales bacterium RIFCSPHIGHO2_01_FULL_40_29]|nr:MAG: tail-specific protease [Bdellovibrionales bacterium RIFCSPHIGHO2_01_FULL_40_29]OFZ35268.1 MAG: tail-specific protease [Bdellovibrionales bacterium RIFCSPHIGHO2_02_FULL_40_15]
MMRNFFVSLLLLLSFSAHSQGLDFTRSLDCNWVDPIQTGFLQNHLVFKDKDKELQNRVIEQYIKRQDGAKIYLLESDVQAIKTMMKNVFSNVEKKDCKFVNEVQGLVVKRTEERSEFIKTLLGKDFKFNKDVEFVYDPDHKPHPKTKEEAEEFLKKFVQFQIANYIATDIKLDEAKSKVIKNYERNLKRTKETKFEELVAGYLNSFAMALDPHSNFFSKDYYDDFTIDMSLSLEGIGATLSQQDGFTTIEALVPGGAASKSGHLEPQDKIIAVSKKDGKMENVIDMDLKDVVKMIRGQKGTKVKLSILRKESDGNKKFDVELVREKIALEDNAVSITYLDKEVSGMKKKIGVINFPSFYSDSKRGGRSSAADLKKVIAQAREKKVDGLVLDLSNNGGGSLDDAVKIGGLFFKTGNVVKQSSSKAGSEISLADTDEKVDWSGPLVILTSRISASASEIVSGALKDYNRAVVVGSDHTYGKGSVQTVLPVPGELGALKVTIGMFFTPGGFSTQHRGVESDIIIPSPYSVDDIGEKSMDYSLPPKKISSFLSKSAYVEKGDGAWPLVKPAWIKSLKVRSQERVSKNEDFKKIVDELEKTKKLGKIIKVSEVIKEKGEKEKKVKKSRYATDKAEKEKEYLKRADIQEAANVLTDLILLGDGKELGKIALNNSAK